MELQPCVWLFFPEWSVAAKEIGERGEERDRVSKRECI